MNPERATLYLILAIGGMGAAVLGTLLAIVAVRRARARNGIRQRWRRLFAVGIALTIAGMVTALGPYLSDKGWGGLFVAFAQSVAPLLGWLALANGVAIAGWAVFADRSRGRRRCPRCWYDMAGVPGLKCPECGRDAQRERSLLRTRRHWKMAAIGPTLFVTGYAGIILPRIMLQGWASALPTQVLIGVLELEGWPRPASYRPRDAAAELLWRNSRGIASWERGFALRRMARYWTFDYRPRWAADVPIAVKPADISWWYAGFGSAAKLRMRMLDADNKPGPWKELDLGVRAFTGPGPFNTWSDGYTELGSLPAGATRMRLELQIVPDIKATGANPPAPFWSGEAAWPVDIRPSIDEILTPVSSPVLDQDVQDALIIERRYAGLFIGERTIPPTFRFDQAGSGWPPGTARALLVEFLYRGKVVATTRYWDLPAARATTDWSLPISAVGGPAVVDVRSDPNWAIRIRSDPGLALRDFKATAYWSGNVTFQPQPPNQQLPDR